MTPIGKGSRFRVLTGDRRGQTITIERIMPGCAGCIATVDGDSASVGLPIEALDGPRYQRLADAPEPPDALLAELTTAANALGDRGRDGGNATLDEIRWVTDLAETDDNECDTMDEVYRRAFVEAAALAIAGIREIDGRTR